MSFTTDSLDAFVAETDRLGGPSSEGAAGYWRDFAYKPSSGVDLTLDPDSDLYFLQMLAVYEEIAGRKLDQAVTEMTHVDVNRLALAESPYADASPSDRAMHFLRLAKALRAACLPRGGKVLDMGCGWGLSSEFLAQLGFEVVAVDINPLFSELVRRRSERLGLNIRVRTVSFEAFEWETNSVDAVLFYECFHHVVRPARLMSKVQRWLRPDGRLILAGEPIQQLYWPNWGLRLDALSVYCIRKFGWFESGWSADYLQRLVANSGLTPTIYYDPDPAIGTYLVGSRKREFNATELGRFADASEWWPEGDYIVSGRNGTRSTLTCFAPVEVTSIRFEIYNYKPQPLQLKVRSGGVTQALTLSMGLNEVRVELLPTGPRQMFEFLCPPWCPDEILHNGDPRTLGFHLHSMTME